MPQVFVLIRFVGYTPLRRLGVVDVVGGYVVVCEGE
jgi:hypothetical protein